MLLPEEVEKPERSEGHIQKSYISALLNVKCREEAEYVCKLLKKRDSNKDLQSGNSTDSGKQKSPETKGYIPLLT